MWVLFFSVPPTGIKGAPVHPEIPRPGLPLRRSRRRGGAAAQAQDGPFGAGLQSVGHQLPHAIGGGGSHPAVTSNRAPPQQRPSPPRRSVRPAAGRESGQLRPVCPRRLTGMRSPPTAERRRLPCPSPPSATGMACISASGCRRRISPDENAADIRRGQTPLEGVGIKMYLLMEPSLPFTGRPCGLCGDYTGTCRSRRRR